jgi:hypothetical protein
MKGSLILHLDGMLLDVIISVASKKKEKKDKTNI